MNPATKTLAAVDAAIIANREEPFRAHLGASVIGDECARRIWYNHRWTLVEHFDARMLRLFSRGHHEEPRLIGHLRAAGVEIWDAGEFGGHKSEMRISAHFGHFGGTPDGIGRGLPDLPADEPFLLEIKTHNEKSFNKLRSDGIMKTKWKHFVQMQVLMGELKLKFALYCAIGKNDDDLIFEIVQFDAKAHAKALDRAGAIIFATIPPSRIGKNAADYRCKYCHLQRLCYFGDVTPARNCRSCAWLIPSKASEKGEWFCSRHGEFRNEAAQRAGCEQYEVNHLLHERL